MKTAILVLALLFLSGNVQAKSFKVLNPEVQQGDVLIIRIEPQWQGPQVGIAVFGRHYVPNRYGEIFIGIDKSIVSGRHLAILTQYNLRYGWDYEIVEVSDRKFPEVKISRNRGSINVKRWKKDQSKIERAYKKSDKYESYVDGLFIRPLDVVTVTDEFNLQRKFLDGTSVHRGTDLKTLTKTPVYATNSGKVILAGRNFLLEGNLVILDHGSGILSYYLHLSKINVREGQFVKNGETIALSGDTGLGVRYPHLHFAVKVNGTNVDPLEFIKTVNENLNR